MELDSCCDVDPATRQLAWPTLPPRCTLHADARQAPVPLDEERILDALHDWTRDTGEPPRSYEWSPGTARSLGRYNERAARWEREWPRWPGTDTLRYHFGRFSQALEAAGLPADRSSSSSRCRSAWRPPAAWPPPDPTVAIADHMGVHSSGASC